jgi:hypothetical protein
MNASEAEDGAKTQLEPVDGHGDVMRSREASSIPVAKTLVASLVVALAAGVVAWSLSDRFRVVEIVDEADFWGGAELSITRATQNGVVGYAILGSILSLGLGVTAGLLNGRRSILRVFLAGLAGAVLGAFGGAASSYGLMPIYFSHLETADLTLSMLIHLGIWTAVGAASGVAFGIGSGSRAVFVQSLIGGIAGAALGTTLFDLSGAFFPLAHTERPLGEEAGTRLAGYILLGLCIAVGIVVVASQKPRVAANKT